MDIVDIVKKIIEADVQSIDLKRVFDESSIYKLIKCRFEYVLDMWPNLTNTVIALAIYPALKWNLKGKEIDAVTARISKSNQNIKALEQTQSLLVKTSGVQPKLLLSRREEYFKNCEELVSLLEKNVDIIRTFPDHGEIYYRSLCAVMGYPDHKYQKSDLPKERFPDAVNLLSDLCGTRIDKLLNAILDGYVVDDEEQTLLYHNTTMLLKEYNRILWYAKYSDDKAMRLLACKDEAEMLALTESDSKYDQAFLLVEYMKLITGAVEIVKEFPLEGEEYYNILTAILDTKPQKVSDQVLGTQIGMSTFSFSKKKRRALSLLGCVLWGCDGDTFIRLLTEES